MVADVYSGVDFGEKNVLSENSQNCRYTELHDHEYIASVFELSDPASYGSIQVQECRQRALLALAGARANTLWPAIRKQVDMDMAGLFPKRKHIPFV